MTLCFSASSYGGGEVALAVFEAAAAAAREPLGRNRPMHGVGCRGNEELGDRTGEERVSIPFSELKTEKKRQIVNYINC